MSVVFPVKMLVKVGAVRFRPSLPATNAERLRKGALATKQSIGQQGRKSGLLRFARNDDWIQLRDLGVAPSRSRGAFRPSFAQNFPPSPIRGRRECRTLGASAAACVV